LPDGVGRSPGAVCGVLPLLRTLPDHQAAGKELAVFLATLLPPEARYVVDVFPLLATAGGLALAALKPPRTIVLQAA